MEKRNVRILIFYLIEACRALGECHVVAAGSTYATLSVDDDGRERLSRRGIYWMFD